MGAEDKVPDVGEAKDGPKVGAAAEDEAEATDPIGSPDRTTASQVAYHCA
jgi:hypothetical protein